MRVRASSLNYRDLMVLKGGGRGATKLGVVPLSDGAGEIVVYPDRIHAQLYRRARGRPVAHNFIREHVRALRRVLEGSRYLIENYRGIGCELIVADTAGTAPTTPIAQNHLPGGPM